MDTVHTAITEPVRRLEVFTGAGRPRKWSDEDKARIFAEIVASGDSVCSVARRHGLSPQQLFGWRRQYGGESVSQSPLMSKLFFISARGHLRSSLPVIGSSVRPLRLKPLCRLA
jgi:transposase